MLHMINQRNEMQFLSLLVRFDRKNTADTADVSAPCIVVIFLSIMMSSTSIEITDVSFDQLFVKKGFLELFILCDCCCR